MCRDILAAYHSQRTDRQVPVDVEARLLSRGITLRGVRELLPR